MHKRGQIFLVALAALVWLELAAPWHAASAADMPTPRVTEGRKLVVSAACETCHAAKTGGDGTTMYTRKDRKVSTKAKLVAQVARCSSELNLGLFPDDESAIADYLNFTYYKFKD